MENPFKSILWTVSIILGIFVAIIGIWQWLKQPYKLEAYILTTKAPLSQKIINNLNELGVFSAEQIRKGYKERPEMMNIPDRVIKQALPLFSKIVKDRVDLIIGEPFLREEYLTVVTIYNSGDQTITGVELKIAYSSKVIAQIERDDGKQEPLEFSGKLAIGNLAPLSKVVVYYYSNFPNILGEYSITLTHDKGLGKISFFYLVPRFVTQTSGFFISYY